MASRNDFEAALLRIAALERELRERDKIIADLRAELDRRRRSREIPARPASGPFKETLEAIYLTAKAMRLESSIFPQYLRDYFEKPENERGALCPSVPSEIGDE